jgi:hypothetical protein
MRPSSFSSKHTPTHDPLVSHHRSVDACAADAAVEIAHLGLMTAISGSLTNALATSGTPASLLDQLPAYTPDNVVQIGGLAHALSHPEAEPELGKALRALHTQLTLTLQLTSAAIERHEPVLRALDPTIDAWRRLAGNCYVVLLLEGCLERHGHCGLRSQHHTLLDLLRAVAAGRHPCVMPDGVVTIPLDAERRSARRHRAGHRVGLISPAGLRHVELANISAQGAMIAAPEDLALDRGIALIGADGRQHAATAVWRDATNAGLRFDQPVDPADLLQLAQRREDRGVSADRPSVGDPPIPQSVRTISVAVGVVITSPSSR